jgi:hypothetical protein
VSGLASARVHVYPLLLFVLDADCTRHEEFRPESMHEPTTAKVGDASPMPNREVAVQERKEGR